MLELKPHIGRTRRGELVEHDQYLVHWRGRHVGYVGKRPGMPINLIVRLPESEREAIAVEVQTLLASTSGAAMAPIRVTQPPPPISESLGDY